MIFSEFVDFMDPAQARGENNGQNAPKEAPKPPSAIIGTPLPRIDGPLKTSGTAMYASDYNFPRMVYAVPVCSTIASGKIKSLDTTAAMKIPGALLVLHHGNIGPLFRNGSGGRNSENRPPFEDETVYYWGQYVAVAVAVCARSVQRGEQPGRCDARTRSSRWAAHPESPRRSGC
jgi:xanthine dehydrogenase YagR molybdenum-binding subunit